MRTLSDQLGAVRRDGAARRVVREWRALTGGRAVADRDRRTLVACSGGADSTALAVVLAAASAESVVLGHVVHDLRGAGETAAERDRVAGLAARLGVGFGEEAVAVRAAAGNAEGNARRARYVALEGMAFGMGCSFVATGHHGDDQLETVLMGLLRGAGVRGLGGARAERALGGRGVRLVRPMLGVGRADAERVCQSVGLDWAEDATNADLSRFRAGLRHRVLPEVREMRPSGAARAAEAAAQLREVGDLVEGLGRALLAEAARVERGFCWDRGVLERTHPAVVSAGLRLGFAALHGGRFADRLRARSVRSVVDAIGCGSATAAERTNRETKRFVWKDTEVTVTPREVTLRSIGDE